METVQTARVHRARDSTRVAFLLQVFVSPLPMPSEAKGRYAVEMVKKFSLHPMLGQVRLTVSSMHTSTLGSDRRFLSASLR